MVDSLPESELIPNNYPVHNARQRRDIVSTSGFVDDICCHAMGPVGQIQARHYISKTFARWRHQVDVRQQQCLVEFIRLRPHRGRSLPSTLALLRLFYCRRRSIRLSVLRDVVSTCTPEIEIRRDCCRRCRIVPSRFSVILPLIL